MARTTIEAVQAVLGKNYDGKRRPDLRGFIDSASVVVDRVASMSLKKSRVSDAGGMTASELEVVERWLAAHLYQHADPGYTSRSTEGASGSLMTGQQTRGYGATMYGETAMDLDWSGCLKNINQQQFAGGTHMGHRERC